MRPGNAALASISQWHFGDRARGTAVAWMRRRPRGPGL